jgi:hypothetical protein
MVDIFLQMPMWLQIFLAIAMVIGLLVLWRFRAYVAAIAVGAVAIFLSIKNNKKQQ